MTTGRYLQRQDDAMVWEEVDLYTWTNWQYAQDQKNQPRYSGNRVHKDSANRIEIVASGLTTRDMAVIMRFCGVKETEAPGSVAGGFVRRPEFVRFVKRGKATLHEVNGEDYVCKAIKPKVEGKPDEVSPADLALRQDLDSESLRHKGIK